MCYIHNRNPASLTDEMKNIDHLVTLQYSAGKLWVLASVSPVTVQAECATRPTRPPTRPEHEI